MRILFVCLGNICRSPTAEAVMRGLVAEAGLEHEIEMESAGTGSWHVGEPPDPRSSAAAAERGIALEGRARQVSMADFERFDLLVAMDRSNRDDLLASAPDEQGRARVRLLREHDSEAREAGELDVPDPYMAGGFDEVVEIIDRACRGLLAEIEAGATGSS